MLKKTSTKKDLENNGMSHIIAPNNFIASESYKAIRTNILHLTKSSKHNQILITSPYAGAGKTTTSANLATTFAQLGKKVLLIDSDMRKPSLHKYFSLSHSPGLADYLSSVSNTLTMYDSGYENLSVITAGTTPSNPSELLHSQKFSQLISELSEKYDFIFIDSPPVDVVTDAVIISQLVTGTVLVVRQNHTEKDTLLRTVSALKNVNANVLGYILNAVDYKKYSYKYGHYTTKYGSKYSPHYYYASQNIDIIDDDTETDDTETETLQQ